MPVIDPDAEDHSAEDDDVADMDPFFPSRRPARFRGWKPPCPGMALAERHSYIFG